MTETNSGNNSDWIRLNVGGKTFQTTKDTLSRHPDTFFARLVNGELPSDKDESGAYLVDGCPEHFDTIMTYLRRGVLNLDGNKNTAKDLLVEADFYKIQPLVDEIQKALNSKWVRLNVGGKIFQTSKDTLSRHPDTFLARLVNGELSSDKDDTGAIFIDRGYEHFGTILDYLRTGVVNFDRKEKAMKDLLCEADFYNIQTLVDEIQKPVKSDWVRLIVGGKTFETTRDTLTRYPESHLARLVNGELPSVKDESGDYFVDGSPERFETILTYLQRGVLSLDGNENTAKDLLSEAVFYKIQPLIDEIRNAMRPVDSDWVRYNVRDKIFQITKEALSRYPNSLLARLVNDDLPSDKDESGAYIVDGSPERFETILTYLHRGVVYLDGNERNNKYLLSDADYYNIQSLVDEIRNAMRRGRKEGVVVGMESGNVSIGGQNVSYIGCLMMSDQSEDNEVLQALRQKVDIRTVNENGFYKHYLTSADDDTMMTLMNIESTFHRIGFEKDNIPDSICSNMFNNGYWKFTRIVRQ